VALEFIDPQPGAKEAVDRLELRLGFQLPASFHTLLTAVSNGGAVEPLAMGSDPRVGIVAVLGAERSDGLDIEARIAQFGDDRLPAGLMPIIDAEGGNLVCLSTRGSDFGTVWFWDHERESDGAALSLLAASFDEFVDELSPLDDDLPAPVEEAWIDSSFLAGLDGDSD
jgi:hypothetical protein